MELWPSDYYDPHYTREEIFQELAGAVARGIVPLLTFSSPEIAPADLGDSACNEVLAMAEEVGGGVIVSSPLLRDYIRAHYPRVEIHASVIMTAFPEKRDRAYYAGLARSYDRYVVHPDDNFQWDLLESLPKDTAEVILNERCVHQCAQRRAHYESIVQIRGSYRGGGELTNSWTAVPLCRDHKQHGNQSQKHILDHAGGCETASDGIYPVQAAGTAGHPLRFFL